MKVIAKILLYGFIAAIVLAVAYPILGSIFISIKEAFKEKNIKKIVSTFLIFLFIVSAVLFYPWFVTTNEYGECVTYNLLGFKYDCRE